MYTNADCLSNKLTSLHEVISVFNPDIIAITEVKPKSTMFPLATTSIELENYQIFTNIDKAGRGIAVYTHNSLKAYDAHVECDFQEFISIKIKLSNHDVLNFICIYRSPNSDDSNNDLLTCHLDKIIDTSASHILVTGDFNLKEIDWKLQETSKSHTHIASKFLEKTKDLFIHQHVEQPTRIRGSNIPSTLDLVFTNEENMIDSIQYLPPLASKNANSDHLVLVLDFKCYTDTTNEDTPGLDYTKGNYDAIRNELKDIKWDELLISNDANSDLPIFTHICEEIIKKHIPCKKKIQSKQNQRPIWMNPTGLKKN
jgi:hypothetical protein